MVGFSNPMSPIGVTGGTHVSWAGVDVGHLPEDLTKKCWRVAHISMLRCGRRRTSASGFSFSPTQGSEVSQV
jgi:hypothetical protein